MNNYQVNAKYGQPLMIITTPDDDIKGNTDLFINDLRVACRKRRFTSVYYGELSIRASVASGAETEMSKIINGKAKAQLYIFEFKDCWIICTVKGILNCLLSLEKHYIKPNNDGVTSACYIKIADVPHFKINKSE